MYSTITQDEVASQNSEGKGVHLVWNCDCMGNPTETEILKVCRLQGRVSDLDSEGGRQTDYFT